MKTSPTNAVTQSCPNCGALHDVGVFVSGQVVSCACGIKFEVRRRDVKPATSPGRSTTEPSVDGDGPDGLDATVARTPAARAAPNRPQVPGYALDQLLGQGGMGEVWRARQLSLDREVAVKVLPERFARDPEFVARFEKESKALAALSHPNIVQIIDRGKAGEHYYFAMELVRGITLRELMAARVPVRDALRIAAQIARAIDAAHEKQIVHRDLKPENVLVDPRGHVKIADFGLAGMQGHERNVSLTATAVAMGTVNYMAPEQRRDAKHVDHRADLYSLGVLIYELLTGELPLGRFKLPSLKVPGLDPRVDDVVAHLLETEPDARPARGLDVAVQLEDLVPPPDSGTSRPSPRVSSGPPGVLTPSTGAPAPAWRTGALLLLGLLGVGVGARLWPAGAPPPATTRPVWYADSEDELYVVATNTRTGFSLDFTAALPDAGEKLNTHTGAWSLTDGALQSVQFGEAVEGDHLLPRAYVAHRYFLSDDFEAQVTLQVDPLPAEFPPLDPEKTQRFAELAFRIKDLQVSLFAIPGTDLRVGWRYFTRDGEERAGNSTRDRVAELLEDAIRVPRGEFRLRLKLAALRNGDVNVEAFVLDPQGPVRPGEAAPREKRFARIVLPGLAGQVGKVALGCRNLVCRFSQLKATGRVAPKPAPR